MSSETEQRRDVWEGINNNMLTVTAALPVDDAMMVDTGLSRLERNSFGTVLVTRRLGRRQDTCL